MNRLFIALALIVAFFCGTSQTRAGEEKMRVLCTTFPIYQIARNVVKGKKNIDLQLMLPAEIGCPHDYALTPRDMKKLAISEVLIINGLGMEEFLGAPVKKANSELTIIDSSSGIADILEYKHDAEHHDMEDAEHHGDTHDLVHDNHEHAEHHHHHHHHEGTNPHLFVSPSMAAKIAMNIAAGLSKVDSDGAGVYFKNATEYAKELNALAAEFSTTGKRLKNNRVIEPHGVFDYLARDMGLEIVAVLQPHGQEPSAAKMLELVDIIQTEKPGVIFTEPQYSEKSARTLSKETGINVVKLDPVASGPENAPINYYQKVMKNNLMIISEALGTK